MYKDKKHNILKYIYNLNMNKYDYIIYDNMMYYMCVF